jgi:glycosyltransferase involved in cell wall biosynthesis
MRILLVYDHLDVGGAQTHGLGLARELIRSGHEVGVASRGGVMAQEFARAGACCMEGPGPRPPNAVGLIRGLLRARAIFGQWAPDLVHAHAVLPGLLFSLGAGLGGRGGRVPVVFTPHRSWESMYRFPGGRVYSRALYRVLRGRADAVIAVSESMLEELARNGFPGRMCRLVPNGVDLGAFDEVSVSVTHGTQMVGTVGRLVDQKGMDVFIDAAARMVEKRPEVRFAIVGDGPLRRECERRMASLGLQGRMELLGERSDVPDLLGGMNVFVSASRWEGMPLAILEAMAAKRPVVATSVPGSSELIEHGVTGLLVAPEDPEAMAQAVLRLLDDPGLAASLGEGARARVSTQYNAATMAGQIMEVYRQVPNALALRGEHV